MNQSRLVRQPNSPAPAENSPGHWNRPTVTGLEADLAYFNARLEFVGIPKTINQKVQLTIFRSLIQSTTRILNHLRQFQAEGG